jgi:hypothetical protein
MDYSFGNYDYFEHEEHGDYGDKNIYLTSPSNLTETQIKETKCEIKNDKSLEKIFALNLNSDGSEIIKSPSKLLRLNNPVRKSKTYGVEKLVLGISHTTKPKLTERLSIHCVTWNLYGKTATKDDIKALLPEKKYDIYAIGSEECMRSIFKSFFYSDKTHWEQMIV